MFLVLPQRGRKFFVISLIPQASYQASDDRLEALQLSKILVGQFEPTNNYNEVAHVYILEKWFRNYPGPVKMFSQKKT